MSALPTTRLARTTRALLVAAALCIGFVGLASPAFAGNPNVSMGCSDSTTSTVSFALTPTTTSGKPGWSYSLFYAGDYRNPWVVSNWTAAYANAGSATTWELVNGAWTRPGPSMELDAPPHYGVIHVWEQKFEIVNGRWVSEWKYLGDCTPPPGFPG